MGFLLWAALTALAVMAGLALALRVGRALAIGEQVVAAAVTAVALVLLAIQGLGYASVLYPSALAATVAVTSIAVIAACRGFLGWREFAARLRAAALAAVKSPASGLLTLVAIGVVLYLASCVYLLPSWGWDAMWYHDPISAYAYQQHSLAWVESPTPFVNSYPKNIELLALWNVIFAPDDRFLDGAQLPLVLMGLVALASMARRAGASAALAWGLSLLWLLMPAVFLNTPSNYVDAGAASLWLAAVLFVGRLDATSAHRFFGALALGAYAGAKVTGLMHTGMIAPVVAVALSQEVRRAKGRWRGALAEVGGMSLAIVLLGGATYIRDVVRFSNPFWPAKVPIPFFGYLNGYWELRNLNTPPFGGADDLAAFWRSLTDLKPFWFVDVRTGGFGPLFVGGLLPFCVIALGVAAWRGWRGKVTPQLLATLVLLVTAVVTPARWWPRYVLGLPAAGILAAALCLSRLPWRSAQQVVLLALGIGAMVQGWPARAGFRADASVLEKAWAMTPAERARQKFDNWQQAGIAERDTRVQPGEASVYDDSVSFAYQLWRPDWQNRVIFRPLQGDAAAWLASLDADRVRWAAVRRGSPAERALNGAHWQRLYACVSEDCGIWARP